MRVLVPVTVAAVLAFSVSAQETKQGDPRPAAAQQKDGKEAKEAKKTPVVALGKPVAGAILLKDLDGAEHEISDLKDQVTVVNFWSITCPVMRGWESRLAAIHEKYAQKGVRFWIINSNEGNGEISDDRNLGEGEKPYAKIRAYLKQKELPYTVLVDKGSAVADIFGAKTTPDVFVFDKTGTLIYRGLIDDDARGSKGDDAKQYLTDTLDALLAGKKLEARETKPQGCSIKRPRAKRGGGARRRSDR